MAGLAAELILVDDGSAEPGTLEMLRRLEREGARLLQPRRNAGPATARNAGLAAATGAWIGFLDADDLWLPGRLTAVRQLMGQPGINWIGGRHQLFGGASEAATPPGVAAALNLPPDAIADGPALTRCLIANFWMHLGAMLVRRDLLVRAGGFAPGLYYAEDLLLMTKLSVLSPLHLVDHDSYGWRRAGGGLTGSPRRLGRDTLAMYRVGAAMPELMPFRRELRWARYAALKGLALNNLLAGRRAAALGLALEAWALDPREAGDFIRLLALWARPLKDVRAGAGRYSGAEIFVRGPAG